MAEVPVGPGPETWLREALERVVAELVLFLRTLRAFLFRPARSARAWQAGEASFMNPLAFGATAAGIYWALTNTLDVVWPANVEKATRIDVPAEWSDLVVAASPLNADELVVVGRRGGPEFLDSEIARLAHLVAMAASLRRNA